MFAGTNRRSFSYSSEGLSSYGIILAVRDSSTSLGMTSGACRESAASARRRKKRWLHNAIGNAEHSTSHIKYRSRLTVCRRRRDDRALMNIRVVFCVIVCGLVLAFVGRAGGDPTCPITF